MFVHRYPEMVTAHVNLAAPHPTLFEKNMTFGQLCKSYYMFFFQFPVVPELWLSCFDYRIANAFIDETMGCITQDAVTSEDLERYKQAMGSPGALTGMVNYYRVRIVCLS